MEIIEKIHEYCKTRKKCYECFFFDECFKPLTFCELGQKYIKIYEQYKGEIENEITKNNNTTVD